MCIEKAKQRDSLIRLQGIWENYLSLENPYLALNIPMEA
jgi:hypothetical protein